MKKLIVFAMTAMSLTIFNGCQKDELNSQLADEVQLQNVVKPDVYVENGYLVVKNLHVIDSLTHVVQGFNSKERTNWEQSVGFTSAITFYDELFRKSEAINNLEEMIDFRQKNINTLKWNEDENDFSFDYPFYKTSLIPLLNKNGLIKIGKSLYKYEKNKRIIILDGDVTMLERASRLNKSTNNIIVNVEESEYLKSSDTETTQITNFEGQYGSDEHPLDEWCEWSSSRKMKTYLNLEKFKYTTYSGNWEAGYRINTWQKAQKKSWGIWVNYYVRYRIGDILYKENGVTKVDESGYYTTGSIKPSYTHIIFSVITIYSPYEPSFSSITNPYPIYFECFTTNEDFTYYPFDVDYSD